VKTINYIITKCPLGHLLIAATQDGICRISIAENQNTLKQKLNKEFPSAHLCKANLRLKKWAQRLVDYLEGKEKWPLLPYDVRSTAFQRKVWDCLRTIPSGKTYYYSEVAKAIGRPLAVRAVARACAANPTMLVVPCHRIVPKSGGIGGFSSGIKRKEKLLRLEKENKSG